MIQEHTLSWTRTQSAARLHAYRMLFLITIAGNVLIGLWCLFAPADFAQHVHQPGSTSDAWPRAWALAWLGLNLLYLPGVVNPLFYRWPNWSSIVINLAMGIAFLALGGGFVALAIWALAAGILLLIAYYRLILADVQSKP